MIHFDKIPASLLEVMMLNYGWGESYDEDYNLCKDFGVTLSILKGLEEKEATKRLKDSINELTIITFMNIWDDDSDASYEQIQWEMDQEDKFRKELETKIFSEE